MERQHNGNDTLPGEGDFVAAFASSNLGDVSPNTAGAACVDTGRVNRHMGVKNASTGSSRSDQILNTRRFAMRHHIFFVQWTVSIMSSYGPGG